MKVFITGGAGMLGSALAQKMIGLGHDVVITTLNNKPFFDVRTYEADIRNEKIKDIIKSEKPDWVVHTAAITNVDLCEKDKELAKSINVDGTKNVIEACEEIGAHLVHISTTFVFDGSKELNSEEDPVNAVNYYAQTKIDAENLVKNSKLERWTIVRPDQIYCWHPFRDNFVKGTINKFDKGEHFKIFDDWLNHPTFAEDLADIIITILEKGENGIFNAAGSTYLDRVEWAKMIARVFEKDECLVSGFKSTEIDLPAKRPNAHVDLSKIEKVLGRKTVGILEGMQIMKKQMGSD